MASPCPKTRTLSRFTSHFSLFFILLVLSHSIIHAQSSLSIGSRLPDNITVKNVLHHPTGEVNLSGYKGKLLILDFWATWCAPCIAMLPKSDSLQKVFAKEVQFLPVTYEPRAKVEKLFLKLKKLNNLSLPIVTDDQQLHTLFPHKELPHYVWIDGAGIVLAITNAQEVTAENIRNIINYKKSELPEKKDKFISYNREQPLLLADLGITKDQVHFESLVSGFIEGLPGRYDVVRNEQNKIVRITAINASLEMLYLLAWSNGTQYLGRNRVIYEVHDATPVITNETKKDALAKWMREYSRCYELIVPESLSATAFKKMQSDLASYFPQYKVSLEKVKRPCLALVRTSTNDKIKTHGAKAEFHFGHLEASMFNCSLDLLVAQLNAIYLQNLTTPVVNKTNYPGLVDLVLDTNLTNVEDLRAALQKFDLDLVVQDHEIEMLIIRDN